MIFITPLSTGEAEVGLIENIYAYVVGVLISIKLEASRVRECIWIVDDVFEVVVGDITVISVFEIDNISDCIPSIVTVD